MTLTPNIILKLKTFFTREVFLVLPVAVVLSVVVFFAGRIFLQNYTAYRSTELTISLSLNQAQGWLDRCEKAKRLSKDWPDCAEDEEYAKKLIVSPQMKKIRSLISDFRIKGEFGNNVASVKEFFSEIRPLLNELKQFDEPNTSRTIIDGILNACDIADLFMESYDQQFLWIELLFAFNVGLVLFFASILIYLSLPISVINRDTTISPATVNA